MIIPALDLIEGQVVRLYQGDYGQVTEYKVRPGRAVQPVSPSGCKLAAFG